MENPSMPEQICQTCDGSKWLHNPSHIPGYNGPCPDCTGRIAPSPAQLVPSCETCNGTGRDINDRPCGPCGGTGLLSSPTPRWSEETLQWDRDTFPTAPPAGDAVERALRSAAMLVQHIEAGDDGRMGQWFYACKTDIARGRDILAADALGIPKAVADIVEARFRAALAAGADQQRHFEGGPVNQKFDDTQFLYWIADRLEHVHGENPRYDYMLKLREIAGRVDQQAPVPPADEAVERAIQELLRQTIDYGGEVEHNTSAGNLVQLNGTFNIALLLRAALAASGDQSEVERLKDVIERDRTKVADALADIRKAVSGRAWMRDGRGSFAWDDERYQAEFGGALDEIEEATAKLKRIASDWSDSPRGADAIAKARALAPAQQEPKP